MAHITGPIEFVGQSIKGCLLSFVFLVAFIAYLVYKIFS